ncbi:MAG: hypothetical protein M0020_09175 [Actinomycetota bacterium]|nr:hypothetical protein [Actinomycetota bacterium]
MIKLVVFLFWLIALALAAVLAVLAGLGAILVWLWRRHHPKNRPEPAPTVVYLVLEDGRPMR